jgi:hypothetical protein
MEGPMHSLFVLTSYMMPYEAKILSSQRSVLVVALFLNPIPLYHYPSSAIAKQNKFLILFYGLEPFQYAICTILPLTVSLY